MRLLLDTNALLFLLEGSRRLGTEARLLLSDPQAEVFVSAACLMEIAIKRATGKLPGTDGVLEQVAAHGLTILPITGEHAWRVDTLPAIHKDPFDRVIVAQALVEDLMLVSSDALLARYGVRFLST